MREQYKKFNISDTKNKVKQGFELQGKLLIAMPRVKDKRFYRTVILVSEQSEVGTKGFIVNQVNPQLEFQEMMRQVGIKANNPPSPDIHAGGPIDPMRGFVLHSRDRQYRGTITINKQMAFTSSLEPLNEIANHIGPLKRLVLVGHQVWGKGEIEKEIKDNQWLCMDGDMNIIFDINADKKWQMALKAMKISPANLLNEVGLS